MTLCLHNKLKNTGDMTCIVHTFCKDIKFWFDMANFSHLFDGMQSSISQHQEDNLKDIIRM